MNAPQFQNRLYAGIITAFIVPWLDQKGIKLNDEQVASLVIAAPIAFHAAAGIWAKICAVFMMYFPPKNPPQPVEPAKVNP